MQLLALAGSLLLVIFSVAAQSAEPVGPCTKARQDAGHPMPGKYIPQCTQYGYFEATQCHGSTGRCWCVVPDTGKAIDGTSVMRADPECSICYIQRAKFLRPTGFVGAFAPTCDDDGLFASQQHWGSTGQSWCVNKYTGEEIQGTRTGPGSQPTDCNAAAHTAALGMHKALEEKGPCFAQIVEARGRSGMPGFYTPTCTENGFYHTEQHHGSTGHSWCVNPRTGAEIPGTRRGPAQKKVECGACFIEIEEKLTRKHVMGLDLPQCNEENGDYLPVQHHEGYSWCANPKTGAVEGKKYAPGDKTPLPCVNN
jgi:nidogen (entactin)